MRVYATLLVLLYGLAGYSQAGEASSIIASADPSMICLGDSVTLSAAGGTDFDWGPWGMGSPITVFPEVTTAFTVTGIDTAGNTAISEVIVIVYPQPTFHISEDLSLEICAGDTIDLNARVNEIDSLAAVSVVTNAEIFPVKGIQTDSFPLPDGTGVAYDGSIQMTDFSEDQTLADISMLESICVNIEHSWMRDLRIRLSCPNGNSVELHDHPGNFGSEIFLGVPNEDDGATPVPGIGFEYCWTPDATNGTWLQYANAVLASGSTLPAGDYNSVDPFSNLMGCPLNGDWTINVEDLWGIDNGFLFSWSISFNRKIAAPEIIDYGWEDNPSVFYLSQDSIAVAPQIAGPVGYTFSIEDDYGCTYDTSIQFSVLPTTSSSIDTAICQGQSILLGEETYTETSTVLQSFSAENGCDSIVQINLVVRPLPDLDLGEDITIQQTDTLIFFPAGQFSSFLWSDGSTEESLTIIGADYGTGIFEIWLAVTDEFDCINSDSLKVTIEPSTGLEELFQELGIIIYPNPTGGIVKLENTGEVISNLKIRLINLQGRVLINKRLEEFIDSRLDLSLFPPGPYFVNLQTEEGSFVCKIIRY